MNRYVGPRKGGRIVYHDVYVDAETTIKLKKAIATVFGIRATLWTSGQMARGTEIERSKGVDRALK